MPVCRCTTHQSDGTTIPSVTLYTGDIKNMVDKFSEEVQTDKTVFKTLELVGGRLSGLEPFPEEVISQFGVIIRPGFCKVASKKNSI